MRKVKKLYLQKKKRSLKKIIGTSERPRLSVFRSHKHIYAQLIDDSTAKTIATSSTLDKVLSSKIKKTATKKLLLVGQNIEKKLVKKM